MQNRSNNFSWKNWLMAPVGAVVDRIRYNKPINNYVSGKTELFDVVSQLMGYDGDRFFGGFGLTKDLQCVNLPLLQLRSIQLFRENTFANIIFNRIMTLTINSGLTLEASPSVDILSKYAGMDDDSLEAWSSEVEALFESYMGDATLIDRKKKDSFGSLQHTAKLTAIISGDCLEILSLNKMGLPEIELVDGINIKSPMTPKQLTDGTRIIQGVELDSNGKEIAYWVRTTVNGLPVDKRVSAFARDGSRRAILVRAVRNRIDDTRGLPLLAVLLQSIKALGNLIDSEERAALINSYMILTHNQDAERPHKQDPFNKLLQNKRTVTDQNGKTTEFNSVGPGMLLRNLAPNEKVESFDTKRPNLNAVEFVGYLLKAGIQSLGWSPEVILSSYNSSFSASRQAKNDTNEKVKEENDYFSEQFCQPVYVLWLDGMILSGKILAPLYFQSMYNQSMYYIRNGWRRAFWRGMPNISVDMLKQFKAYEIAVARGWMNDAQVSRDLGSDLERNLRILKKTNEKIAEANEPLEKDTDTNNDAIDSLTQKLDDILEKMEG